jgi:aldehyde:ferredoxin oxidoreductase
MLNAKFGLTLTIADVISLGQKVLTIEKEFNTRAGFNAGDDRLPEFFKREKLPPHNTVFDVSDSDLDKTLVF